MSRNTYSKWQQEKSSEDDDDSYKQQDLRYKIEEGRKVKPASQVVIKPNVIPIKHEEKQAPKSSHLSRSRLELLQHHKKLQKLEKAATSTKPKVQPTNKQSEDTNKKKLDPDIQGLSKIKKARLEAETEEIVSDGSNDEAEDDRHRAQKATDSQHEEVVTTEEVERSNIEKAVSEGELSNQDNEEKHNDSDKDKSVKSLEDVSSDDEDGNLEAKSGNDDTDEYESKVKDTDEGELSDKEKRHHRHKHSRRKKSKRSSRKHSKKHHKHKDERSLSKEKSGEETTNEDEDVVEIENKSSDVEEVEHDRTAEEDLEDMKLDEHDEHEHETNNLNNTPPLEHTEDMPIIERYNCAIEGCRSVEEFECLNRIEEGAYGVVYRAKDKKSNELVALKRLKMEKEREGFPITSLREIDTLLKAQHPNIVTVREIVVGSNMDKIYMVMDFVEHDLKSLMQYSMKNPFLISEVKTLMLQLLSGIAHLHDNWIIHRDLKTSNLLLSHKGVLKIADFGLAREYGSPLKEYTPIVVTLWYRSVELLLGVKKYSTAVDVWSVGCIFGELLLMKALFQGKNEKDQLDKIFKDLGTPNERIWPGYKDLPLVKKLTFADFPYNTLRSRFGSYLTDAGFDLLKRFLTYDPAKRISAEAALKHQFFQESPAPKDATMFPTWPAKSEGSHKKQHDNEPKAPEAGKMYEQLLHQEDGFALQLPIATGFQLK